MPNAGNKYTIYLDTTALVAAGERLSSPWFTDFASMAQDAGMAIHIPELVLAEWIQSMVEAYAKEIETLTASVNRLASLLESSPADIPHPPTSDAALKLSDAKRALVLACGFVLITTPPILPTSEFIGKAIAHEPPFAKGDAGFKDAVILETIRAHAKGLSDQVTPVVISDDAVFSRAIKAARSPAMRVVNIKRAWDWLDGVITQAERQAVARHQQALLAFVRQHQSQVFAQVRQQRVPIRDIELVANIGALSLASFTSRTVKAITSVEPIEIVGVHESLPQPPADKCGFRNHSISVRVQLGVVFENHTFRLFDGRVADLSLPGRIIPKPDLLQAASPPPDDTHEEIQHTLSIDCQIQSTAEDRFTGIAFTQRLF